jgi:DNA-binding transcriptional MerR regulator
MEGGFRLYSEEDVSRVEQIKQLQNLLGLTLAEIKEMVEAEEIREELRATYRPDLEVSERIKRTRKRIEVTQRQFDIISSKLTAMKDMKKDLDERLGRYHKNLSDLEEELRLAEARSSS